MKMALIGASGNAGSRVLAELSRRGHHVTAIARHPESPFIRARVLPSGIETSAVRLSSI
jgi:putative NADH-flavin reductase